VLDTFGLIGNSSFGIHPDVEGPVLLNNIKCIIDADKWTINPADADPSGTWRTYAFYLGTPSQAAGKSFVAKNLHSFGYLTVLPPLLEQTANASNFRSWFTPNKLPVDSYSNYITPDKWHYKNITEEYNDSKITKYLITNRVDSGVSTGEEVGGIIARSNDSDLSEAQQDCASIIFVSEGTISSDAKVGISFRTRVAKADAPIERVYIKSSGELVEKFGLEDKDGNKYKPILSGTTANRPAGTKPIGLPYYNTTLGRMEWWNGTAWANVSGNTRISKELNIPDWDMTDLFSVIIPHGLSATEWKTIRNVGVEIRNDADTNYVTANGEIIAVKDSTNIELQRVAADRFDSADYDTASSYNRGFITFTYIPD
jgi:hypothetical protein